VAFDVKDYGDEQYELDVDFWLSSCSSQGDNRQHIGGSWAEIRMDFEDYGTCTERCIFMKTWTRIVSELRGGVHFPYLARIRYFATGLAKQPFGRL